MKQSKIIESEEEKGLIDILYDFFRSLKLTISLLILLAILSIIGTVITQNATRAEYIQRYGIDLYNVLNFFNLFDMYHSWWFSAILLLLVINLIACSINRFPRVWRQVFRGSGPRGLEDSMLKALSYIERIRIQNPVEAKEEEEIRSHLKRFFKKPKRIEGESYTTLYSEKGSFSRFGVYLTHFSILIILTGGLAGSLYGFRGHAEILEGGSVNQIFLRIKDDEIPKPLGFSIRCDDFKITYYDLPGKERHVKEYTSLLTILKNGKEVLQTTVKVNHPLHYKGLAFYQSTYGSVPDITLGVQERGKKEKVLLKASEGEDVQIPNSDAFIRVLKYVPQIHTFGEGIQMVLFGRNQAPKPFWVLKNKSRFNPQRENDDYIFTLEGVTSKEYTGLQVAKDPGVWVVWVGCALMIFGLIVSFFFSHQRVWVRIPKGSGGEIILAGSAYKNRVGFEKTFSQLVEGVRSKSSEFACLPDRQGVKS